MFEKLYKLKKGELEEIRKLELDGKENKIIREVITKNFSKLFAKLELYNEGKEYVINHGEFKGKKPDALAFCREESTFYIFEYKSGIDEKTPGQVLTYYNSLRMEINRRELAENWNDHLWQKGEKQWKFRDFQWNNMKIICISPSFGPWTMGAEDGEKIILINVAYYEDESFYIKSKNEGIFKDKNTDYQNIIQLTKQEFNEKIEEQENDTKKWMELIDEHISNFYPFLYKSKKNIFSWLTFIYYREYPDTLAFSVIQRKKEIKVRLNLIHDQETAEKLTKEFILKLNKENYSGEFKWEYIISNEKSFQKFFDLIKFLIKKQFTYLKTKKSFGRKL